MWSVPESLLGEVEAIHWLILPLPSAITSTIIGWRSLDNLDQDGRNVILEISAASKLIDRQE